MDLFLKLVAVLKAGWPLPTLTDKEALEKWFAALAPALADFIATAAGILKVSNKIEIVTPAGTMVLFDASKVQEVDVKADDPVGHKCCESAIIAACSEINDIKTAAFDFSKLITIMQQMLPVILQIIAVFTKEDPKPIPPVNS